MPRPADTEDPALRRGPQCKRRSHAGRSLRSSGTLANPRPNTVRAALLKLGAQAASLSMASPEAGILRGATARPSRSEEVEGAGAADAVRVWKRWGESWKIWNVRTGPSSPVSAPSAATRAKEGGKSAAGPQVEVQVLNIRDRSWFSLTVPRGTTVGRLKGAIETKTRIARPTQRLVCGGAILTDRTLLSSLAAGPDAAPPPILLATMLKVHELKRHESQNSSWYFNQCVRQGRRARDARAPHHCSAAACRYFDPACD